MGFYTSINQSTGMSESNPNKRRTVVKEVREQGQPNSKAKAHKINATTTKSSSSSSSSSLDTTTKPKVNEIDELFAVVKKRKEKEVTAGGVETHKKDQVNKKKRRVQIAVPADHSDDSESDPEVDPYFEFIDSDEEERQGRADDAAYGLINNAYNPNKIVNPEAPLERIDPASGLPVYKAHILRVGEGGGTPLCPFDCNCCF
jgi:hypothetical protein